MNEPMQQHGFTMGRDPWLVMAVALGLALSTQAAAAKDCRRETPLPTDVRLIAPGPKVPEAVARFAGAWTRASENSETLCYTLVVEEVLANGYARVIYSYGTSVEGNIRLPGFFRVTGRIVAGELGFQLPIPDRPRLAYQVTGETLTGTVSGVIVDGVLYVRGCETRWGPYPYCREMRHAVFSVTKSLGAAVALLRLAQTYGDQVFDLKIKDYVPVTAAHDGWERVTFGDALNMAAGIGDNAPQREPNDSTADEGKPKMLRLARARTAKEKLPLAFSYGKYPWGPGEVLRYNSTHTFILAAAMDSFLKRQVGPTADLWDMVVTEVFQPIGILHMPQLRTQETDGGAAFRCWPMASTPRSTMSRSSRPCCSAEVSIRGDSC